MYLTADILRSKSACADQVRLFTTLFPGGVQVTPEACVSVAGMFHFDWAAKNLLPGHIYDEYKSRRAASYADYHAKRTIHTDYRAKPLFIDFAAITAPRRRRPSL